MRCPDQMPDESGRLRALASYQIDPVHGLPSLNPIVDMAVKLFDCPMAAVNLVGDARVFLAANIGIGDCDLARDVSFCAHAITQDGIMVVEDAALDPRFHDNPIVLSGMVRFYAGVALRSPSGHALGALCVIDPQPRSVFTTQDRTRLMQLAAMVADRLELRRMEVASAGMGAGGFAATAMGSPNAILSCNDRACLTDCNAAAAQMFGRAEREMIGMCLQDLIADADRGRVHDAITRALQGDVPITEGTLLTALRRDGTRFEAELHWSRWREDSRLHFGVILRDLSATQSERDALYQLANFDSVTQLPNPNLLLRHLDQAFADGLGIALVLVDLDGFHDINSTLGRGVGDRVLRHVAGRIRGAVPTASLVARLSGVKFGVLIPSRDPMMVVQAAHGVNAALAQPLRVEGQDIRLGGCCGLALAPDHARAPDELLGSAELALQQAHGSGRGGVALFMPHMRAQALARRRLDGELHRAFELGQFTLFFQPQVALDDGRITGAEVLIRWLHPEHGLLLPCSFLPALEAGPLAEAVGGWVLDRACAQLAQWRRLHSHLGISVNLSVSQFRHGTLPGMVAGLLAEHDLPPDALELEITENIILNQQDRILAQLCQIRAMGVNLSFDDFGTGFASLNLLRNFPVTHIKIDKGFTQLMQTSDTDRAIVRGVIHMVRDLGLQVIAEGVENAPAAHYLRQLGCHKGQGYYFGKPCSAVQFAELYLRPQGQLAQA